MPTTSQNPGHLTIRLNGESRDVPRGWTIAALVADVGLDARMIVVERNREIIRDRNAFGEVGLQDGDVLEFVHFVGGG
jgi:sulfur carrier protein